VYKISRIPIYLLILAALTLQLTVLGRVRILGAKPDLMLTLVVFFGVFLGGRRGLEAGLAAGLLLDIFALDYFWLNTFTFGITGLLAGVLGLKVIRESRMTQTLLVFFFTIFFMTFHFIIASNFSRSANLSLAELTRVSILPSAVYTSLVSIPIFSKLTGLFNLREEDDML